MEWLPVALVAALLGIATVAVLRRAADGRVDPRQGGGAAHPAGASDDDAQGADGGGDGGGGGD